MSQGFDIPASRSQCASKRLSGPAKTDDPTCLGGCGLGLASAGSQLRFPVRVVSAISRWKVADRWRD